MFLFYFNNTSFWHLFVIYLSEIIATKIIARAVGSQPPPDFQYLERRNERP